MSEKIQEVRVQERKRLVLCCPFKKVVFSREKKNSPQPHSAFWLEIPFLLNRCHRVDRGL